MDGTVKPTNNLLFHKWLGSPEHIDVTTGFVNDFYPELGLTEDQVHITTPYTIDAFTSLLDPDRPRKGKKVFEVRRDVALDLTVADQVTEMQVRPHAAFVPRALYYLATRYASRYDRNRRRYKALRPIYGLNLTGFPQFPEEPSGYQRFQLQDQLRPDGLRLPYWQVSFFDYTRRDHPHPRLGLWAMFLRGEPLPADAPGYLHTAAAIIDLTNLNQEERAVIDLLEKEEAIRDAELDYAHQDGLTKGRAEGEAKGRAEGEAKGRAEGEAQGRAEERTDLALAALRLGVPIDTVAKFSGLGHADLETLLQQ